MWTAEDDAELKRLVALGTKSAAIARDLVRTKGSIGTRMAALGLHRREGDHKISKAAAAHIRAVDFRLSKAAASAAPTETTLDRSAAEAPGATITQGVGWPRDPAK